MLPEKINVQTGARTQSYDIMNIGEARFPLGENLTRFSWSGTLPGAAKKDAPYLRGKWADPKEIQGLWSVWRARGIALRLMVTGTPVNHDVYLENYNVVYGGYAGDYNYTISFYHGKDIRVNVDSEANTQGDATEAAAQDSGRPEPPAPKTHIVARGDTLWRIAQKYLGDGKRYPEIHAINQPPLGADPNEIREGQVLTLP
jgi:hypothetical protein